MSLTLLKYIAKHFFRWMVFVFLALAIVIFIVDLMELLRRTSNKEGVDIAIVIDMALLKLPTMMQMILPFSMLLAALFSMLALSRHQELVIARAAGFSVWKLLLPYLMVALLTGIINASLWSPLAATTYREFLQQQATYITDQDSSLLVSNNGLWIKQQQEQGYLIISAKKIRASGRVLVQPTLFFINAENQLQKRLNAARGILQQGRWTLSDVTVYPAHDLPQDLAEYTVKTTMTPAKIIESFAPPETISFWAMLNYAANIEEAGMAADQHYLHFYRLLVSPVMLIAMIWIAALFALRFYGRHMKVPLIIVGTIVISFIIYFVSDILMAMGLSGQIPLGLSALVPAMVTNLLAIAALFHFEDS